MRSRLKGCDGRQIDSGTERRLSIFPCVNVQEILYAPASSLGRARLTTPTDGSLSSDRRPWYCGNLLCTFGGDLRLDRRDKYSAIGLALQGKGGG